MKKQLFFLLCLLFVGFKTYGQELIKGGNMEDASAWYVYWNTFDAVDTGTFEFNYTADVPTAGDGGCYRVTAAGQAANMLWQKVTIIPGHSYELTGAYKYLADTAVNVWVEFFITRVKPVGRNDTVSGEIATGMGYGMTTWDKPDTVNLDGTFQENFMIKNIPNKVFLIPDTVTQTEWYVAVKAGCWNSAGAVTPVYDLCIDELSLIDKSLVSAGGNMEDPSAWNVYWNTFDAVDTGTYEFNYTGDVPSAGKGGCYRVTAAGQAANMLWQPVTIVPGHQYKLEGAYKYIADTAVNVWVEYFLTRTKPVGRNDTVSGEIATGMGYGMTTWDKPDTVNLDGTFQDNFMIKNIPNKVFLIPDTVTQTVWYLAMKAGCWNSAGDITPVYDLLFDEIYLYDLGPKLVSKFPIAKKLDVAQLSPNFAADVSMRWDAANLYLNFNIKDDSIVTAGGAIYTVDNIEIYFDMNNGKLADQPRNNTNWPPAYQSVPGYYQERIVPGFEYDASEMGNKVMGVKQEYKEVDGGYTFALTYPWDSLKSGFVPSVGSNIGFDIDVSDNNGNPFYRNQITWNAPLLTLYRDPATWGTIQFANGGLFNQVLDVEKPKLPENLAVEVTGKTAKLSWDASTDNIIVQNYIIYNGTKAVDTLLAKLTGNSATIADLKTGDNTLGVAAADLYWNKSAKATIVATATTGIDVNSISSIIVYPNPSNGTVNLLSDGTSQVTFELYNMTGSIVISDVFTSSYELQLTQGIYFIHLKTNENTIVSKVIVR